MQYQYAPFRTLKDNDKSSWRSGVLFALSEYKREPTRPPLRCPHESMQAYFRLFGSREDKLSSIPPRKRIPVHMFPHLSYQAHAAIQDVQFVHVPPANE